MKKQVLKVIIVHHEYEKNGYDRTKFIGVFSNRVEAKKAIENLKKQPGFKTWPKGFQIHEYQLGEYFWKDGFGPNEKLLKLIEEAETWDTTNQNSGLNNPL